jgi:putative flippase GtrA
VGIGVFGVDFSAFITLTAVGGLGPLWANPISRTLGAVACFFGQRFITFGRRDTATLVPLALRFVLVFLLALGLSQVYLWFIHHVCGLPAAIAKPLAEGLVFFGNFLALGRWAFT